MSVSSGGAEGDRNSGIYPPAISSDGRFIAFDSDAKTLAPNDTNNTIDVYVRDQTTGVVTCISVDSTGASGNGASFDPALSADGRYVAFFSDASNLITNDANQASDVFVRDRDPGADGVFDEPDAFTFRVSVSSSGAEADGPSYSAAISADGMVIVFATDATNLGANDKNNSTDVFLHDRNDGTTTRMSLDSQGRGGKDDSYSPSISADGKIVTFASIATNLVPSDLNGKADLFLRDRANGTTERLSVDSIGIEGDATTYGDAALSSDGSIVAFLSEASNLVDNDTSGSLDVFVRIRAIF